MTNTQTTSGTVHVKSVNDLRVTRCHKFIATGNVDTDAAPTCKRCVAKTTKER